MPPDEVQTPVAPASNESVPVADPTPTDKTAEIAPTVEKLERDLRAQSGRARAATDRATRAEAEVRVVRQEIVSLREQLGQVGAYLTRQQEEKLASMPAEQRMATEIQMLRSEVKALKEPSPSQQPQRPQESIDQYVARRSKQIISYVNQTFDLEEGQVLTDQDRQALLESQDEDGGDEEDFYRRATQLAKQRLKGAPVANKNQQQPKQPDAVPQPVDPAAIAQQVAEQVLQTLGVSRGSSPRPTGGGSVRVTGSDLQQTVRGYNPKVGPQATLQKLREQREEAASKVKLGKK